MMSDVARTLISDDEVVPTLVHRLFHRCVGYDPPGRKSA